MRVLTYFICFILISQLPNAQNKWNLDSLKKVAEDETKADSSRSKSYCLLAKNIYYTDADKALHYIEKSCQLAQKTGKPKLLADAYNIKGVIYKNKGDYKQALQLQLDARKIIETLHDTIALAISNNDIGILYKVMKQYVQALPYYKASNELCRKTNYTKGIIMTYNNIGTIFSETHQLDSAEFYYKTALDLARKSDSKSALATCLNNMGEFYGNTNQHEKALQFFMQCLTIDEENEDSYGMMLSNTNIAGTLIHLKKFNEAISYIKTAEQLAKENDAKPLLVDIYNSASQMYIEMNNYTLAYNYLKKSAQLKDSLLNKETTQQIAEMQTKYESEKKESQIKELKQQQEIQKLNLKSKDYLLVSSGLFILLISVSLLFYMRHQKNQRLLAIQQTEENERRRMAKDIHDDLGSGLSKIKFMSEVVSSKAQNNTDVLAGIKSISDTSIRLVENMRDLIWALNPENTTLDGLVARIREYSYDYLSDTDKKLQFNIPENIPLTKINTEAHRNIFFIVKEALQNIVKHANASEIIITIGLNENFNLSITDNGTGMNETHMQGNGLRNMKQRAEIISATFNIKSSQKGTEINLFTALNNLFK